MAKRFKKDPSAVLDYYVDWSTYLQTGEVLTDSSWDIASGITKDSDEFTDTTTVVWLSGGTVGVSYTLTNHITTDQGREDDWTITIVMVNR